MKKILLFVFSVLMFIPICVNAGSNVAKIGEKGYTSLDDAISEATSGQTIEILSNINYGGVLTINKELNFTGVGETRPKFTGAIEVNNVKVTITNIDFEFNSTSSTDASKSVLSVIGNTGDLTVTNSNIKQLNYWFGIQVGYAKNGTSYTGTKLTLNNVNVEANFEDAYGIYVKEKGAIVNINNSTIKANDTDVQNYGIAVGGSNHVINIKNSTIEALNYHAIRVFNDNNTVNVTDGSIITAYAPISMGGINVGVQKSTNTTIKVIDSTLNARITDSCAYGNISVEEGATATLIQIDGSSLNAPIINQTLVTDESNSNIYKHGIENRGTIATLKISNSRIDANKEGSFAIHNRKDLGATITSAYISRVYVGAELQNLDNEFVNFDVINTENVITPLLSKYSFYADAAMTNLIVVTPNFASSAQLNLIIDEQISNLTNNENIVLLDSRNNVGDNLELESAVLTSLKGTDATLVIIPSDVYTIEIKGSDITDATKGLKLKISELETLPTDSVKLIKDALNLPNATETELKEKVVALDFEHEGVFPGKIKIMYKTELEPGTKISITYFDSANKKLVYVKNDIMINEDGYFTVELNHASQYLLSLTSLVSEPKTSNPKTGDAIMTSIVLGSISLIGLLGVSISLNKKTLH